MMTKLLKLININNVDKVITLRLLIPVLSTNNEWYCFFKYISEYVEELFDDTYVDLSNMFIVKVGNRYDLILKIKNDLISKMSIHYAVENLCFSFSKVEFTDNNNETIVRIYNVPKP
jgi:hypothetical protein